MAVSSQNGMQNDMQSRVEIAKNTFRQKMLFPIGVGTCFQSAAYSVKQLFLTVNFQVKCLVTYCNLRSHDCNITKFRNAFAAFEVIIIYVYKVIIIL